jgi:hypothetical protein
MKGTVTVSTGETPPITPPPPPGGPPESPLQGAASRALRLAKSQRGSSVSGSVNLSQASAGGKLEVILLAKPALLAAGSSASSRVGRLVRSPIAAGRVSFAVRLERRARRALHSRGKLALMVQVIVRPPGQAALTLKRGVVVHV